MFHRTSFLLPEAKALTHSRHMWKGTGIWVQGCDLFNEFILALGQDPCRVFLYLLLSIMRADRDAQPSSTFLALLTTLSVSSFFFFCLPDSLTFFSLPLTRKKTPNYSRGMDSGSGFANNWIFNIRHLI